jgi:hypothetical protein
MAGAIIRDSLPPRQDFRLFIENFRNDDPQWAKGETGRTRPDYLQALLYM